MGAKRLLTMLLLLMVAVIGGGGYVHSYGDGEVSAKRKVINRSFGRQVDPANEKITGC